ncbi:molybdopterin-guanine dinucleotide biosynthesis protein MobA [Lysobacter enzymogenes]|uniref:molybdenum cofactor guanylyltransferase n=1 Tax=Lysobacter enzymogenes TaxID=69 RepID=UPI0019D1211C|nr:NTP transferase domain-containing protein [Lysobacter enzymogenes]MBN7135870.1 molybdopterin-guanine dinucleotide biosynthesis protein MobA [Lysobacter enzymogenes]
MPIAPADLTLGLLAGGRATRLGGRDKAWLRRDGEFQVLRLARAFAPQVARVLVSANRDLPRYAAHGLRAVADRAPDLGPLGGLDALAAAADTPWLLSVPVDALRAEAWLLDALEAAQAGQGAFAVDDDGVQPLFALWPLAPLRAALAPALAQRRLAVRELQAALGMAALRLPGLRLGNLNTPADLAAAGVADDPPE